MELVAQTKETRNWHHQDKIHLNQGKINHILKTSFSLYELENLISQLSCKQLQSYEVNLADSVKENETYEGDLADSVKGK